MRRTLARSPGARQRAGPRGPRRAAPGPGEDLTEQGGGCGVVRAGSPLPALPRQPTETCLNPSRTEPFDPTDVAIVRALGFADRCSVPRAPARPPGEPARATTIAEAMRDMRGIADALGVPERGVQLVSRVRQRLLAISSRVSTRPKRRVAVLESLVPMRASGRWLPELIEMAGGIDPCAVPGADPVPVDARSLAEADPDALFVAPRGRDLAEVRADVAALGARAPWAGLRAQREGQVFLADGRACFHCAGPQLAPTLEVLAEALHPEAFRFGHAGKLWERANR